MDFRKPAIYIIIVISLAVALGWSYFTKKKDTKVATNKTTTQQTTQEKISNLTNIDPTDFDSITKETYSIASSKSLEANSSNKLAAIEVKVDGNLSPDTITTRYIFNSSNDAEDNWVIAFSGKSNKYIRMLTPVKDYMGVLSPMNTKAWKYNFVTALQLAEKNGGLTWRENQKLKGVNLTLKHTGKKMWLLWVVEYQGESDKFTVQLDANSGRVVEE
jgi:hypothetical protein